MKLLSLCLLFAFTFSLQAQHKTSDDYFYTALSPDGKYVTISGTPGLIGTKVFDSQTKETIYHDSTYYAILSRFSDDSKKLLSYGYKNLEIDFHSPSQTGLEFPREDVEPPISLSKSKLQIHFDNEALQIQTQEGHPVFDLYFYVGEDSLEASNIRYRESINLRGNPKATEWNSVGKLRADHLKSVSTVRVSPDERYLAVNNNDQVALVDLTNMDVRYLDKKPDQQVFDLQFSGKGDQLFFTQDSFLRGWDLKTNKYRISEDAAKGYMDWIIAFPNTDHLAIYSSSSISFWNTKTELLREVKQNNIFFLRHPRNYLLAYSNQKHIWSIYSPKGELIKTIENAHYPSFTISRYSPAYISDALPILSDDGNKLLILHKDSEEFEIVDLSSLK